MILNNDSETLSEKRYRMSTPDLLPKTRIKMSVAKIEKIEEEDQRHKKDEDGVKLPEIGSGLVTRNPTIEKKKVTKKVKKQEPKQDIVPEQRNSSKNIRVKGAGRGSASRITVIAQTQRRNKEDSQKVDKVRQRSKEVSQSFQGLEDIGAYDIRVSDVEHPTQSTWMPEKPMEGNIYEQSPKSSIQYNDDMFLAQGDNENFSKKNARILRGTSNKAGKKRNKVDQMTVKQSATRFPVFKRQGSDDLVDQPVNIKITAKTSRTGILKKKKDLNQDDVQKLLTQTSTKVSRPSSKIPILA